VLVVLAGALSAAGVAISSSASSAAVALLCAAAALALLGGRAFRARFERDRVRVTPAVPFRREHSRPLLDFAGARVETVGEARRRKADRLAREYERRSGGSEMPIWLRTPTEPGTNDHLRRIILVPRSGEPFAVTAWLAEDDLAPALAEIEALLAR
jgi:hypothetical protein